MTQAEIENHLEISDRLLQHAYEQFEAGDLLQASEKRKNLLVSIRAKRDDGYGRVA